MRKRKSGNLLTDVELSSAVMDMGTTYKLDLDRIARVSDAMRDIMSDLAPEFVNAAEGFAEQVIYIPVSALGVGPEVDPATGSLGVRPNDVDPCWAEVPLLYLLSQTGAGLIPSFRRP